MQKAFSKIWLVVLAVVLIGTALFASQGEFLQGRFGNLVSFNPVTKGEILDTMLRDAGYTLQPCTGKYVDVPTTHEYCEAIETAIAEDIITLDTNGTVGPDDIINKGAAAKIACAVYGLSLISPAVATFSGVTNDQWSYPYVGTLAAAGAVSATKNFNPGDDMTVVPLKYWTSHLSR